MSIFDEGHNLELICREAASVSFKHLCLCKQFQSIIFSSNCDLVSVKEKIEEVKSFLSPSEIDHQLILAFSFDYNKIPLFQPLLSKSILKIKDFIHFDQEFLFHLIQSNISFPLMQLNRKNKTPLHYAAEYNSKEIGELLISKGADINAIDIIYLYIIILFLINII